MRYINPRFTYLLTGEIIVYGIPMGVFRSHELEFANSNVNNPTEMRFQNYAT